MTAELAIILAAHGNHDASDANRRVRALAGVIERDAGLPVIAAFNLGSPGFAEAIERADARRVLVVPLMTSQGYFSGTVLPRRCAEAPSFAARDVRFAPPVGARQDVADAIAARLGATLAEFRAAPAETTVLIVGHGTRRSSTSANAAERVAAGVARAIPGIDARAVFLDAAPLIERVSPTLHARTIIVVPFLLGGGDHAQRDIPARLGLRPESTPARAVLQDRRRIIFEPALLDEPALRRAIMATIEEARRPPIRLATRRSPLAMWQAERVREAVARVSARPVEFVGFDSSGDLDQSTPVDALPGAAPFTDAITSALAGAEVDLATHSLKDLPLEPDARMPVVAVLERGSVEEVLIAREGARLDELPAGARIGVSCARRRAQLRRLRPDLVAAPIRGPVDRRVAMVLDATYDGAILAAAGVERLGLGAHITERFPFDAFAPAAGQGAITVQARADDDAMSDLASRVGHEPTARAVEAELMAARVLEPALSPVVVAAAARVDDSSGDVVLFVRTIAPDGSGVFDTSVRAATPADAASEAIVRVLEHAGRAPVAGGVA